MTAKGQEGRVRVRVRVRVGDRHRCRDGTALTALEPLGPGYWKLDTGLMMRQTTYFCSLGGCLAEEFKLL